MFPNYESQLYRFEFDGMNIKVVQFEGLYSIYTSDSSYMPDASGPEWCLEEEDSTYYWVGAVYGYKMTDDTTLNVYTTADYLDMAYACTAINQIPDFEILEPMIGYTQDYNNHARLTYQSITHRAKTWLSLQQATVHTLAEGAD